MMKVALVRGLELSFEPVFEPPDVDELLREELMLAGVDVLEPSWRDTSFDWSAVDLAVVRTAWDYTSDLPGFLSWISRTAVSTRLLNPPEALFWSSSKLYLFDLQAAGVPVVPSALISRGEDLRSEADAMSLSTGCGRLVVKPLVAVGASGAAVFESSEEGLEAAVGHALLLDKDVVIQPYRPGITDGELSVVILDGEFSHAVMKVPRPGEFRVQSIYGGRYTPAFPGEAALEVASAASSLVPGEPAFCRVDMIEHDGAFEVSEVEAVEPDLYLGVHPSAAARLAEVLIDRADPR